jgi:hypothetical protein
MDRATLGSDFRKGDTMNDLSRRHFLRTSGAAAAAVLPSLAFSNLAQAVGKERIARIWNSADVLIGNSPADQVPGPIITCPFFLPNGHPANASHTLDLSDLASGTVKGNISWNGDTISPDFSPSLAATTTTGSDGEFYLLTAGEAEVSGGAGHLRGVSQVIVRCKYKAVLATSGLPLLVACDFCVAILVRD